MSPSAPLSFDQSQQQVEGMMERGTAFAHVEDAIDTAPLAELHKAALWLLAWSLRDHVQQRRGCAAYGGCFRRRRPSGSMMQAKQREDIVVKRRVSTTVVRNELRLRKWGLGRGRGRRHPHTHMHTTNVACRSTSRR